MKLSRRNLLKIIGLSSGLVGIATGSTLYAWWNTSPDQPFECLNNQESAMVRSLCEAAFQGGPTIELDGADANLDRFFDQLLTGIPDINQQLLKLLLHALDHSTWLSHQQSFTTLSKAQRSTILENWLQDDNHLFRSAVQSVIVLLGIGYTMHPIASKHLSQYFRCGFGL